jgi:hypothetical protein
MEKDISSEELVLARSLARHVVNAIINETQAESISSPAEFLNVLLDKGAPLT